MRAPRIIFCRIAIAVLLLLCYSTGSQLHAQEAVSLDDRVKQHIFSYRQIEAFEDPDNVFSIHDVSAPAFSSRFKSSKDFIPKNYHFKSTYWFRIKIDHNQASNNNWVLEFYDQTIDHIAFFSPDGKNGFKETLMGASLPFNERTLSHKNPAIQLSPQLEGAQVYYFAIQSRQPANIMVVLKRMGWFIQYGLREYFLSGFFYGMILVFCLYNLVMFIAFRQRQYLYYIMYNLAIGIFEMSSNGFAYQYLWPQAPEWNEIAYGVALYLASVCSMLFTREFLYLKSKAPLLNKLIIWVIGLRTAFFLCCLFINHELFVYKFVDAVPLLLAFYCGIYILRRGYHPARFFVAGYSFLVLGFIIRVLKTVASHNLPFGPFNFYSLSFCFFMEMLFVSFAIGDKVKWLRKKKDIVQKRMMAEMRLNQELKDNLNRELEKQVEERTREVVEKSGVIELQNEELLSVNELLKQQAEEISRMNAILEKDNELLQGDIKKVTQARVMSAEMTFEEFANIYPDDNTCFKFLADLKWEKGYVCRKCGHTSFFAGHLPYSRRCSKCSYEESTTANTLFQHAHIPLNKAFYMVYIVYTTKGKISSYKLSEALSIRQSTCWSYSSKVKKLMEERKKELRNAGEKGWSKLVPE
ncbi:MAG: 7TM diverse intracellular signaling domain-containing protein [Chitinophagaceae bacterium]